MPLPKVEPESRWIDSEGDFSKTPAKRVLYLMLGSLSIVLGAWAAERTVNIALFNWKIGRFNGWGFADAGVRAAVVVYFIWIGVRAVRRAGEEVGATRFGWGKMLLGVTLIYAALRGHFTPTPGSLPAEGIDFITGLFYLVGIALIVAGLRKKKQEPAAALPEQSNSAAGHS